MPRPQRLLEAPLSPVDSAPAGDAALLGLVVTAGVAAPLARRLTDKEDAQ